MERQSVEVSFGIFTELTRWSLGRVKQTLSLPDGL